MTGQLFVPHVAGEPAQLHENHAEELVHVTGHHLRLALPPQDLILLNGHRRDTGVKQKITNKHTPQCIKHVSPQDTLYVNVHLKALQWVPSGLVTCDRAWMLVFMSMLAI